MNRKPLALVADDDIALRVLAREALERAGLRVEDAVTGREAVEAFQREVPEIVLLDVMMPNLDGFAACSIIRCLPHGATVPIMMMTDPEDVESIGRAFDVGATDFIPKPLNALILSHRVRYLLRARQVLETLRENERSLAEAQRIAHLGNWRWDLCTDKFTASDEVFRILGVDPDAFPGTMDAYLESIHPEDRETMRQLLRQAITQIGPFQHDHRVHHPVRGDRVVHEQGEVLRVAGGTARQVVGTIQDITDRRQAEAQIQFLAYYDQLTQLPNRRLFQDRVSQALRLARRHPNTGAILLIDLDRFQRINDTLGPIHGDQTLKEVAQRLMECVRKSDSVARQSVQDTTMLCRLGGDEFTILLTHLSSPRDAAKVAQRILKALGEPYQLQGKTVVITASIGIASLGPDGEDVDTLLRNAEAAMHAAKGKGRNTYQFYSQSMNVALAERLSLESDLRKALERDEFLLHYQPQVAVRTWDIAGVEALIRWRHPDRGMVSPASFIPLAEEIGLIGEIGRWVLWTACRQQVAWSAKGLDLSIAVNLSGVQFHQSSLLEMIAGVVKETGAAPAKIELELTESIAMQQADSAVSVFRQLKAMGFRLSIDDFGTGYSSLAYLKRFPLDTLKIDRAFVKDLAEGSDHAAIPLAIIAMAHGLNLHVLAEGVETQEQLAILREHGCDAIQGYLFSQPLSSDLVEQLVRTHRAKHPASLPLAS
jgi:diguanylate cyclase (GGDEF)-like protein/PAS domain S-box-containing protein